MKKIVVAVDGPAGSGKSTICKLVSKKLDLDYIDTGAMYRALTLKVMENNIDVSDTIKILEILKDTKIELSSGKVYLDNIDVSDKIRTPLVTDLSLIHI